MRRRGASPRGSGTRRRPASWTRVSPAPADRSRRLLPGSTASCRTTYSRTRTRGSIATSSTGAYQTSSCDGPGGSGAWSRRSRPYGRTCCACRSARTLTASPRSCAGAGTRAYTRHAPAGGPTGAPFSTGATRFDAKGSKRLTLPTLTSARTPPRWPAWYP